MADLAIIIVNYETSAYVTRCVASLQGQCPPHEVIVVDNPSSTEDWQNLPSGIHLVRMPKNIGYGLACNAGAAVANPNVRFICILNPDIIVPPGALQRWVETYPAKSGILAPVLLNENRMVQKSTYSYPHFRSYWANHSLIAGILKHRKKSTPNPRFINDHFAREPQPVDWVVGAAMLMNRDTWDTVGGFHPDYFLYSEDTDICYRASLAGYPVLLTGQVTLVHTQGNPAPEVRDIAMVRLFTGIKTFLHLHYGFARRVSTKSAVIADMLIRVPVMLIATCCFPGKILYRKRLRGCLKVLGMFLRPPL